jgi:hypothetical protein
LPYDSITGIRYVTGCANNRNAVLLYHLIGEGERTAWHGDTERFGGPKVDDIIEFGGLQDWKVGRLLALENAAGVDADLAISILNAP